MEDVLLRVESLTKSFEMKRGPFKKKERLRAVSDVSLSINKGETYSLVGESGCGKSTTGRLLNQLITPDSGEVWLEKTEISKLSKKQIKPFNRRIQMVFQDPYASLNPRMKVFDILAEPLDVHLNLSKKEKEKMIMEMLEVVGLNEYSAYKYPHEFSGGQRQRIGIARALILKPDLIIADEPVSALDVSIQSQILNLFKELQKEFNLAYLFISHDLSVVEHISDKVAVMYLGKIVESGPKQKVFESPKHPYTKALLSAVPVIGKKGPKKERIVLKGDLPSPVNPPTGCSFHTRCPFVMEICQKKEPFLQSEVNHDHQVACHLTEH
ncbi:peptide ABC transporter substrate-binding protein [Alkalihalobacillus alcalophilus ATCC 27647 = CGMCC 1.3604]|uniref:Oligopeptide transporter n=1 Tax=Alkalihalobacillus alcalophilus ATCC 27647 = CGMCC 1.3604 TaxID=1218173 RepID=J8TM82_ALKAL|nr:dipeptide ABC transporter ATP-binding protein [Alkalihalobacillus alcalophilus]AFV25711.1 oligopeptide transporter [Alkalihalobacillus alcalophilus ATCC 27647 = CGMCC 1.3604]KGA98623.1 peptide ABC transporter ATPase [Alkalihalobacillus alcalophilus ATCC 27647 = CGMCC 1.3604]MED1562613.1 dipeptide ABC transporter ATP-binding protein [Alkalihalobacillus alcalophilus]THG91858.1 peptide ABC transporter substrate-binding protein [Alkalihalobacillus alcalophilus ATCC 27647 = CGMCC 1.3604]